MRILITGGTGSLGRVLVKEFSSSNNEVYFTYKSNKDNAIELSNQFHATAIDIKDINEIDFNFDIIINNAAISGEIDTLDNIDIELFKEVMDVNVVLPTMIIKRSLPYMKKNKYGRIINISSVYGLKAEEELSSYCVSKSAIISLTKSVTKENAKYGITCNTVLPGAFESDVVTNIANHYVSKEEKDNYYKELVSQYPAGRIGKPEEIAKLVKYLTSDDASFINGASIPIDGGYLV